jgi:amidase
MGCNVEDIDPDLSGADESFRVFRALMFYQHYGSILERNRDQIKETVIQEIECGSRLTGPEIANAETTRSRLFARMAHTMTQYDYLALPVAQVAPFSVDHQYVTEIGGIPMKSYIDWMGSCYFISMTALPAISVPAGFTSEGLPVGLQIVGRHQDDWGVLQIAHAFQSANALNTRPPVLTE